MSGIPTTELCTFILHSFLKLRSCFCIQGYNCISDDGKCIVNATVQVSMKYCFHNGGLMAGIPIDSENVHFFDFSQRPVYRSLKQ